ncbi:nucleotide sugar dehydrogenase [Dictyobacter kobayashii]|uniref:Nucleotide sugar dehydrogenase n=1 Tax=Dictyobacter kobayashii TaxID=2014872 RepID=A0A402APC6_9CHLR|nr:nucleotide sugar dehydrogenase [Dictyobacter kobayashii]GCE20966.1 nucleotide sugar dehydrogenase [Dictyobacter kobayashii]
MPQSIPSSSLAPVAVIGLGKIGLPLAVQYALHGRQVIGCDINPRVIESVKAGISHVQGEPELSQKLAEVVASGHLDATCSTSEAVKQAGVVVVIVPVVVNEDHEVDFSSIDAATVAIGNGLRPGTLVIYETTLPVGTTAGRFAHILSQQSGYQAGQDFQLAYSPERVSSGCIFRDLRIYPKVVGGIDEQSTAAVKAFYRSVLDDSTEILVMDSADDAELVKLIETTYRDVNIALANEYARFADARGLNINAAIVAANTQPYSHIHTPGVGVGGHCIPVYPYFLLAGAADLPSNAAFPQLTLPRLARRINDSMAEYAVQRIENELGSLAGRSILILGVAYRGNIQEVAFTSAQLLQSALVAHGAEVYVDDPLFSAEELHAQGYAHILIPEDENKVCAIILQAAHQEYTTLASELAHGRFAHCQVILDGRNALPREAIEALGRRYIAIGDGQPGTTERLRREYEITSPLTS